MNTSQISLSDFQCGFRHLYSAQKCFLFMTEKQRATTEGLMTAKISFYDLYSNSVPFILSYINKMK